MATAERSTGNSASTCICRICESVRETIGRIFSVLENYGWLLDAYIVDFYVDDLWNRLPDSWRYFLEDVTPEELGGWIIEGAKNKGKRVWPLSLLALRNVVEILQINRDHTGEMILKCENIQHRGNKRAKPDRPLRSTEDEGRRIGSFSSEQKLRNLLSKHVKPKKIHEIDVMAEIIADCAARANTECVADVGAGVGHLARKLAYEYEICVTCVEQQSQLSDQARKLDTQFGAMVLKYRPDTRAQKPCHVSAKVEREASESSRLMERLNRTFETEFRSNSESSGFGLIGLHPCGDLATTLLECYAESDRARFISIAGCCYMKLTLNSQSYPLSKYLRSSKVNELSYTALEVACHAVENHCWKLKSAKYWELKIHAYRAALEVLLVGRSASLRHTHLKSVKLKEAMTFQEYCIATAQNLFPAGSLTEIETRSTAELLEHWERVMVFGSLRLMLAPLVESVVLLDRFLYLSERNLSPRLKAVFDPLISPRNFVITSIKS